jgi:hypothetical protein
MKPNENLHCVAFLHQKPLRKFNSESAINAHLITPLRHAIQCESVGVFDCLALCFAHTLLCCMLTEFHEVSRINDFESCHFITPCDDSIIGH